MKISDFITPEDLEQAGSYHFTGKEPFEESPPECEFEVRNRQGDLKTVFIQILTEW
jgi:hypothetical protein